MFTLEQAEELYEDAYNGNDQHVIRLTGALVEALARIKRLEKNFLNLPNAVFQSTPTNCFAGCVATLLEVPIETVPGCDANNWNPFAFSTWLYRRGLQYVEIRWTGNLEIFPPTHCVPCIVTGLSPRQNEGEGVRLHATVGTLLGSQIIFDHDPHPSGKFLLDSGDQLRIGFFVPLGRGTVFPPKTEFVVRRRLPKSTTYIQVAKLAGADDEYEWSEWYETKSFSRATRFTNAEDALAVCLMIGRAKPAWKISIEAVIAK